MKDLMTLPPLVGADNWDTCCAPHLARTIDPRQVDEHVGDAANLLRDYPFDAIAATGISGLLFAARLGTRLNKPVIAVRKNDDTCHSSNSVEGGPTYIGFRFIVVDDFISTGATLRNLFQWMASERPRARCVGIWCYDPLQSTNANAAPYYACAIPMLHNHRRALLDMPACTVTAAAATSYEESPTQAPAEAEAAIAGANELGGPPF